MKNIEEKKHLENVTYLRGIAILGVVIIHTITEVFSENNFIYLVYINLQQISTFSIPLFIFISGLVLTYNYHDKKIDYIDFIKRRLNVILIPYLIWSCIYLIYRITINQENIDVITAIKKIAIGSAYYHLYFIILLLQFYLFFPLILKFIIRFKTHHITLISFIFIFNLAIISIYYNYYFDQFYERIPRILFIFWIFYFILGSIIGLEYDFYKNLFSKISPNILNVFLFFGLGYLLYSFYSDGLLINDSGIFWMRPEVMIYAMLFILIAFKFSNELNHWKIIPPIQRLMKDLGKNSFGIYLSHVIIIQFILVFIEVFKIDNNYIIFNICLFVSVTFFSLICVKLINRLPFGHFIFGYER